MTIGMGLICALSSGCATTGTASGGDSSNAVPPAYKQIIAAAVRSWEDGAAVQSGQISAPHVRWMGLAYGGTRPAVCVLLIKPLLFGNIGPAWYLFYFDNGRPDYVRLGNTPLRMEVGCGGHQMAPFPEVTHRKS
jgi:hypothetical protein